jgi:hypothetical protein
VVLPGWIGRHDNLSKVPLQDIRSAAAELENIAKLGLRGATIRPTPYNGRRLNDPAYQRFWDTAEE